MDRAFSSSADGVASVVCGGIDAANFSASRARVVPRLCRILRWRIVSAAATKPVAVTTATMMMVAADGDCTPPAPTKTVTESTPTNASTRSTLDPSTPRILAPRYRDAPTSVVGARPAAPAVPELSSLPCPPSPWRASHTRPGLPESRGAVWAMVRVANRWSLTPAGCGLGHISLVMRTSGARPSRRGRWRIPIAVVWATGDEGLAWSPGPGSGHSARTMPRGRFRPVARTDPPPLS